VRDLFNLEVDLIFVDTTSTYFEIEGEDADQGIEGAAGELGELGKLGEAATVADEAEGATRPGLRKRGYSKDNRADLAQAVIGFAVTRDGLPVR
jgi:hypothetical protein